MRRYALLLGLGVSLLSAEPDALDLLGDLSSASEIATRSKLNIDKTPAIVSVLHADQLKVLGITNLFEALETVPGIETSMGTAGAKQINMRGNKSIVRDKLKLMVNGISVNTEATGASFFYLDMPIELIERIEVIRGPSSALYGSFAHIGAINVITKSSSYDTRLLFGNAGSEGYGSGGFVQSAEFQDIKVSLDGFYLENDNSRTYGSYKTTDIFQATTPWLTNLKFYEDFTNVSLGTDIRFGDDLSFQVRWLQLDLTNHYGYGEWPISHDPKSLESTSLIAELRYQPTLNEAASMDIKAGLKRYEIDGGARMVPYSLLLPDYYDQIADGYINERVFYGDAAVNYETKRHKILGGLYAAQSRIMDTYYYVNNPDALNGGSEATTIFYPILPDGIKRNQYAFYLHDIYTLAEQWTLNVGARYDHYSDADAGVAPKIALLYSHNDFDSYKLMYQRSFRAPTFLELYGKNPPLGGNEALKTETIDTVEFAYNHTAAFDNRFSVNLFYSDQRDFIETDSSGYYANNPHIHSYGAELEWFYPLSETAALQSNYSYVRAKVKGGEDLPFFANHLANVMLSNKWSRHVQSGTTLRYVGKRRREAGDARPALEGYTRFDQSVTYTQGDLSLQLSVKNLFNDGIYYPARLGDGSNTGTYYGDFPRDGRTFWVSLQWRLQ